MKKYDRYFKEVDFVQKLSSKILAMGQQVIYAALLLFYAYKRTDTPYWAKHIIIGALGYLLSPIDALPDLTPILGFTDDLGVLTFALVTIACYINDEVRLLARDRVVKWFKEVDEDILLKVDKVV